MYSKNHKKDCECKQVSSYIPLDLLERFDKLYPHLRSVFILRCIEKAVNDSVFFERAYFGGE